MKGKLYGIGVGPGDPGLITIKAVRVMKKCDVIAVPEPAGGERTAFNIIESYVQGKELLECAFAMSGDMEKRRAARRIVADKIMEQLADGRDVGFITLGDSTIYSTYMYIHRIISAEGYDTEIIPGISSFQAAAAAFGVALCEKDEPLVVLPVKCCETTEELLDYPGNKVIMKSGENLKRVLEVLKERGYGNRTKIASRVAMAGQKLYDNIEAYEQSPETGYFTVAIVKEKQ